MRRTQWLGLAKEGEMQRDPAPIPCFMPGMGNVASCASQAGEALALEAMVQMQDGPREPMGQLRVEPQDTGPAQPAQMPSIAPSGAQAWPQWGGGAGVELEKDVLSSRI